MDTRVLIHGAPRSGTSILTDLLRVDPHSYISHETGLYTKILVSGSVPSFLHHLNSLDEMGRLGEDRLLGNIQTVQKICRDYSDPVTLVRLLEREMYQDRTVFGDKMPDGLSPSQAALISKYFPFKLIHIHRDARDSASSMVERGIEGSFGAATTRWLRATNATMRTVDLQIVPSLSLPFRDLVEHPGRTAHVLSMFLNVDVQSVETNMDHLLKVDKAHLDRGKGLTMSNTVKDTMRRLGYDLPR